MREQISAAVLDLEPVNKPRASFKMGFWEEIFLRHFRVTFDFRRGVIRLEPLNKTAKSGEHNLEEM